jgi:hypothetical protein
LGRGDGGGKKRTERIILRCPMQHWGV